MRPKSCSVSSAATAREDHHHADRAEGCWRLTPAVLSSEPDTNQRIALAYIALILMFSQIFLFGRRSVLHTGSKISWTDAVRSVRPHGGGRPSAVR